MAVANQNTGPPAVIEIVELHSPSEPGRNPSQADCTCDVVKCIVAAVEKDCWRIVAKVGLHNILIAIVRVVARGGAHTRLHGALFAVCNTGRFADFGKSTVVIVVVEKIWSRITSNVHVGPSIVVEIGRQRSKPIAAGGFGDSGGLRNIGECAVPVVVVKRVDAHFKAARSTHNVYSLPSAPLALARPGHRVITEIHVAHHEKVDFAIAVIVEKTASRAPFTFASFQAGRFAHLTESPIAVIVIQDVLSPIGNE